MTKIDDNSIMPFGKYKGEKLVLTCCKYGDVNFKYKIMDCIILKKTGKKELLKPEDLMVLNEDGGVAIFPTIDDAESFLYDELNGIGDIKFLCEFYNGTSAFTKSGEAEIIRSTEGISGEWQSL